MDLFWSSTFAKIKQFIFSIDIIIYEFIGNIYDFLLDLAQIRLFGSGEIKEFATNIYVLLGIIMLFKITVILMGIIVSPTRAFHEKEGYAAPMASKIVITLVILIAAPSLFDFAYEIQNAVLREGVITKLFSGISRLSFVNDEEEVADAFDCSYLKFSADPTPQEIQEGDIWFVTSQTFTLSESTKHINKINYRLGTKKGFKTYSKEIKKIILPDDYRYSELKCPAYAYVSHGRLVDTYLGDYSKWVDWHPLVAIINQEQFYVLLTDNYYREADPDIAFSFYKRSLLKPRVIYKSSGKLLSMSILRNFLVVSDNDTDFNKKVIDLDFVGLESYVNNKFEKKATDIRYYLLISTITGLAVMALLLSSCFDIALRTVKLGFLQLTAPLPIITYMEKRKGSHTPFDRWLGVYLKTYFDIFIRVAALSFISYVLGLLLQGNLLNDAIKTADGGTIYNEQLVTESLWLLKLFIIFGLLLFAKQAPGMIASIFGVDMSDAGNMFEFNPFKKAQEVPGVGTSMALAGGAVGGFAGGMATGKGFGGKVLGAVRGTFTGGIKGAQKVPLGGFQQGAKIPIGQTFTPFTALGTGVRRAEAGNRVTNAKSERRQARPVQRSATSAYDTASNARTTAETGMIEGGANRDALRSINQQLEPQHDSLFKKYNEADQRYITSSSNVSQLNNQLQDVRDRKQVINQDLGSLLDKRTQTIEEFNQARSNPNLMSDNRDYIQEIDQLTANIDSEAEKINNLNIEERDLMSKLSIAEKEAEDAKDDREEVLPDLVDISHEMANNEEEARDSEKTSGYYEQVITDSDNKIAQHQRDMEQAQEDINTSQSRVVNAKKDRENIE